MKSIIELDKRLTAKIHNDLSKYRLPWMRYVEFTGSQIGYPAIIGIQWFLGVSPINIIIQTVQIILVTLLMMVIKPKVSRKRPVNTTEKKGLQYYDNFSFPSGHATRAGIICAISIISTKFWPLILIWGLFIGLSRVIALQHFLGDVIAGFLGGLILSLLSYPMFNFL